MPSLAAPLKKWIAQCKAYAAKHGCSYKEAMSALKKSRKRGQNGGGVADHASSVEGFALEGNQNMGASSGAHAAGGDPAAAHAAHAGAPSPPGQSGGQAMFEAGAVAQQGGRRRRRSRQSKRKSRNQNQNHSQSQNGGKRRRSQRQRRRRSSRGGSGSSLSYSQY